MILSSYSLAHFYLMKKYAKVQHCFGLYFFKYSAHEPSSKRKLYTFPRFLRTGSLKKSVALRTHDPTAEEVGGLELVGSIFRFSGLTFGHG
jgi:hypothetical protein